MNSSKWIPWQSLVPLTLTDKENFSEGPFYSGTGFWVCFPPFEHVFLVTARHCIFHENGNLKGKLNIPLDPNPSCTTGVSFLGMLQDDSECQDDVAVFVVDPARKEQLEKIRQRSMKLGHQEDVDERLACMVAIKGKLRTAGFPYSDKEIDYKSGTAFARVRGFIGVLTGRSGDGRYILEQATWKDADGDMQGYSGSPIIDLIPTEIDLNAYPDKIIPTADGKVAIAFKSNEDTPHRPMPVGVLVTGSNNIARFISINVVTGLIDDYLLAKPAYAEKHIPNRAGGFMPAMSDPHDGYLSFRGAVEKGILQLDPCTLYPEMKFHADEIDGEMRFTYTVLQGNIPKGILQVVPSGWENGIFYFQLGIAVGDEFRNQGVASLLSQKGIEEFVNRFPLPHDKKLGIEAVISELNVASQKVAARSFSDPPIKIIDKHSGEPALRYELIVTSKRK